jgi:hypothetical protein
MNTLILFDALGAQLKSAEEERGRLVESVLAMVSASRWHGAMA